MKIALSAIVVASAAALSTPASADLVQVEIVGSVDFGTLNFGSFAGMGPGTPVNLSFQVDSDTFLDGSMFPTRGYNIDMSSFSLTVGTATVGMPEPYPFGQTPYFVLRNNDPAVDGFFLGTNPDSGFEDDVFIDEPALIDPFFKTKFIATYTSGSTFPSLDILDATGTYDFTGISSFNWGLTDAGIQPVGFIFDYFEISVVPAPATVAMLAPLAVAGVRRRR